MAIMIPYLPGNSETLATDDLFRNSSGAQGEIAFYIVARDYLPSDWTVIYNQYTDDQKKSDHQIDFLVLIPRKGILNVDAKGFRYSWHHGGFYLKDKNGQETYKDLFGQVNGAIHQFDSRIKNEVSMGQPWGAYGRCLMFMLEDFKGVDEFRDKVKRGERIDGIDARDRIPGGMPYMTFSDFHENGRIVADNIIDKFNQELDKHLEVQGCFEEYRQRIIDYYDKMRQPINRTRMSRAVENSEALARLFECFTQEQKELMNSITSEDAENKFLHIQGCAGSGKTLLAMYAANYFLNNNRRVLYVCYNKNLAESVKNINPRLKICNIDKIHTILGRNIPYENNPVQFRQAILNDLMGNAPNERYDVILMDEAQDMDLWCFRILFLLLPPNNMFKKFIVFSDDQQSIFNDGWTFPEECNGAFRHLPRLELNLRNSLTIWERDQKIYQNRSKCGQNEKGKVYPCRSSVADKIESLRKEGYAPYNIAVLAFNTDDLIRARYNISGYKNGEEYSSWQSSKNTEWDAGAYIWCGCAQGFKGLEADCLLLVGNVPQGILGHTAVTRARYELIMMES